MRCIILLFIGMLCQFVNAQAQQYFKVSLSLKDQPLEKVFREIKKQTGYTAFYNDSIGLKIRNAKVSISVTNATIEETVKRSLAGQPLDFKIIGDAILILEKSVLENLSSSEKDQELTGLFMVQGSLLNQRGEQMDNVNVMVKRTGKGTISDERGNFQLGDLFQDDILVCSMVGYNTIEVPLKGRRVVYINMIEATNILDRVVLQGYGKTSRRLATGNISKVSAEEIQRQPVANPLQALQGRVPGLVVTQTNGYATAPMKVAIRGVNSLTLNTEPLYIIDGVPVSVNGSNGLLYGASFTGGLSPIFNINPEEVESIEVLKDADATAIYGSRGSNGVILISTKKGKPGPTRINLDVTQGVQSITRYWDMLNTEQYLDVRRKAFANDGLVPGAANAPDLLLWDSSRYTNWQKELWGGIGLNTNASVGLSGGDRQTTFRINGSFTRITNITSVSGATKRGTLAFSLGHTTLNQKVRLSLAANYTFSDINVVQGAGNARLAPNAPAIFDGNGDLNWAEWNANGALDIFPFGTLLQTNPQKTNALTSNLGMSYQPIKGLTIGTQLGYTFSFNTNNLFVPLKSQNPFRQVTGAASFNTSRITGWNIEPQANYHFLVANSSFDVLVGATLTSSSGGFTRQAGSGYTDDNLLYSINNAPVVDRPGDEFNYNKYAGLFARVSYKLKNRYLLNLNGRRDGNSNFGPGRQYGNFGSVGAAWIVSDETWAKSVLPDYFNFVKLRGSYGTTGTAGAGPYQYLSLWGSSASLTQPYPAYNNIVPYIPQNPPNQNYQWEVNRKLEGALEFALFDEKLSFGVARYATRTGNQITNYPLPRFTGFPSIITNLPAVIQNSGWEGFLNADIFNTVKSAWSLNFAISSNKNKLVSFPDLETSPYAFAYTVGQPLTIRYFLHYLGIDPLTGQYAFEDRDKNGVISSTANKSNADSYVILNSGPRFSGGAGTSYRYKSVSISVYMNFVKQLGQNALSAPGVAGSFNQNLPALIYGNNWEAPGDQKQYPAFTNTFNQSGVQFNSSDAMFTDASFLRLNNLAIAWQLPQRWMNTVFSGGCMISLNAQNLITFTRYEGIDPETQNFGGMPPVRTLALSVRASL